MTAVGMIGLGVMGLAMAKNLSQAGFEIHGYDIDPSRRKLLNKEKEHAARSIEEVAKEADVLITSLPSTSALFAVSHSLAATYRQGITVVETSTLPIKDKIAARRILNSAKIILLDCPLSGTGSQAQSKDLVVYGSGQLTAYKKVLEVMRSFSRKQFYLGAFGNGMKLKLVANYLVAIHNAAAAEALILAEKTGLKLDLVLEAISDSAGQSRMWEVRGPRMVAADYSPMMSMHLWQKDMAIISEFAAAAGSPSTVFDQARELYDQAYAAGHGDRDSSVIHLLLKSLANGPVDMDSST